MVHTALNQVYPDVWSTWALIIGTYAVEDDEVTAAHDQERDKEGGKKDD